MNTWAVICFVVLFMAVCTYCVVVPFDLSTIAQSERLAFASRPKNSRFISNSSDFYYNGRCVLFPVAVHIVDRFLLFSEIGDEKSLWLPLETCTVVNEHHSCRLTILTEGQAKRIELDPDTELKIIQLISELYR